jgi:hypothetical protein
MNRTTLVPVLFFLHCFNVHAQKIVLQLDATPATTPTVSKAALKYNKDFAYSFTFDDCFAEHYTMTKPFFTGGLVPGTGYTSPGFFYTDGCGNDVNFKVGIAWNSTRPNGLGPNANDPSFMSWAQLQEVYNLGWDVINHSYAHRWGSEITGSYTYSNQISQNTDDIRNHLGIETPCFASPTSDVGYNDVAFQLGQKIVLNGNFSAADLPFISFGGIPVDGTVNTTNYKVFRHNLNTERLNSPTLLSTVASQSTGGVHKWYDEFTHHINGTDADLPFTQFKDYMVGIANTYGKNGSDRMWFTTPLEVFEYIVSRQNANFTTNTAAGNKLEINLNLSSVPTWMRRKVLTLVVNSTVNFSSVTLPAGITATWRGTGATKLLNLDFTNYVSSVPVELVNFSAAAKGTTAHLAWETASEKGFKGFEIERSLDGKDYTSIGFVKANGRASKYSFDDTNLSKTSYYRLKMIDLDGSFDFSRIVSILLESKYKVNITPSVSDDSVTIETDFEDNKVGTIEVYNQAGKLLKSQTAARLTTISLESFPQGIYFVRVNHGIEFWVRKVAKF